MALILLFTSMILVMTVSAVFFSREVVTAFSARRLVVRMTRSPPQLDLALGKTWHLFISYSIANQEKAGTIKRRLQELIQGVCIFVDVDDICDTTKLNNDIEKSTAVLALLSATYFQSPTCMAEATATEQHQLPLIPVHVDAAATSLSTIKQACPKELIKTVFEHSTIIEWVADEVAAQGAEWATLRLSMLKQIAEQMLLALPLYRNSTALPLGLPGERSLHELTFDEPVVLFTSHSNEGAKAVAAELAAEHEMISDCVFDPLSAAVTPRSLQEKRCLLVHLNDTTFLDDAEAHFEDGMAEAKAKVRQEEHRRMCTFSFVAADYIKRPSTRTMAKFQELVTATYADEHGQRQPVLVEHSILQRRAFRGEYKCTFCSVSHRWMEKHLPDPGNEQLEALKRYLDRHDNVKWVWYDL